MMIERKDGGIIELVFTDAERARDGKWFDVQVELRNVAHYDPLRQRWVSIPAHEKKIWEIYHKIYGFQNKDQLKLF